MFPTKQFVSLLLAAQSNQTPPAAGITSRSLLLATDKAARNL